MADLQPATIPWESFCCLKVLAFWMERVKRTGVQIRHVHNNCRCWRSHGIIFTKLEDQLPKPKRDSINPQKNKRYETIWIWSFLSVDHSIPWANKSTEGTFTMNLTTHGYKFQSYKTKTLVGIRTYIIFWKPDHFKSPKGGDINICNSPPKAPQENLLPPKQGFPKGEDDYSIHSKFRDEFLPGNSGNFTALPLTLHDGRLMWTPAQACKVCRFKVVWALYII